MLHEGSAPCNRSTVDLVEESFMRNAALSDSYFTPLELANFYTVAVKMLKSGLIINPPIS